MSMIKKSSEFHENKKPLVNIYRDGGITLHSKCEKNDISILTNFLKDVNIDFNDIGYNAWYKISVEQRFLIKSMIIDGEYSELILGQICDHDKNS